MNLFGSECKIDYDTYRRYYYNQDLETKNDLPKIFIKHNKKKELNDREFTLYNYTDTFVNEIKDILCKNLNEIEELINKMDNYNLNEIIKQIEFKLKDHKSILSKETIKYSNDIIKLINKSDINKSENNSI